MAVVAGASVLVLKENVDDVRGAVVDCVIDGELDVSFFSLLSVVPIPPKLNAGFDVLLLLALGNENGVEGLSVDGVAKLNFLVAGSSVFYLRISGCFISNTKLEGVDCCCCCSCT